MEWYVRLSELMRATRGGGNGAKFENICSAVDILFIKRIYKINRKLTNSVFGYEFSDIKFLL